MNRRESIDFDFFDTGDSQADRGRQPTRLDRASDENDYQSAASGSARSTSTAGAQIKKIEARLPSASTSHVTNQSDSGASSDRSSGDGSGTYGSPPPSSSSGTRRQISFSHDTKDPERATKRGGGGGGSSDDASSSLGPQAWSDESLSAANRISDRKPFGQSRRPADGCYDDDYDGGFGGRNEAGVAYRGRNNRPSPSALPTRRGKAAVCAGGRPSENSSDPEITWETDSSDVSVSPLNSPDSSPLVTPRKLGRAGAAEQLGGDDDRGEAQRLRWRSQQERGTSAETAAEAVAPCRVTRSSNEVAVRPQQQQHRSQGRGQAAVQTAADAHDEDKLSLNLLLKALLECDDRPPQRGAGERRHGRTEEDRPSLLEAEHRHLLQNLLGMPTGQQQQQKERRPGCKAQREPAVPRVTSATVNRAKEQRRIELENLALLKRLQAAKPTRELQRKAQLQDYYRQLSYHTPQLLRSGDAGGGGRGLSSSSAAAAAAASCYGTKLGSKSQSLQSLRSIASSIGSSKRSTVSARARPASASRGLDGTATFGAAAVRKGHTPQHGNHARQSGRGMTGTADNEPVDDALAARWEDGW